MCLEEVPRLLPELREFIVGDETLEDDLLELAKRFSRQRIDPLLEETPVLRDRVAPARARDSGNTMLSKEFPCGILVLTGANSAVGLRSMTARFLFLDEVARIQVTWPAMAVTSSSAASATAW